MDSRLLPLADGEHEIPHAAAQLLSRGWLRIDAEHRLYLTDTGEAARVRLHELVTELRAVVHDGISDEEYVAALKVLRRMISNVEGAGKRTSKIVPCQAAWRLCALHGTWRSTMRSEAARLEQAAAGRITADQAGDTAPGKTRQPVARSLIAYDY